MWLSTPIPGLCNSPFRVRTVAYEITVGLLFIINRKYMKIALIMGIIFCLGTTPVMIEAVYTNVPLALIQAFLLSHSARYAEDSGRALEYPIARSGGKGKC